MLNGYEREVKREQISFKSGMKATSGWAFDGVWKDQEMISKDDKYLKLDFMKIFCETG